MDGGGPAVNLTIPPTHSTNTPGNPPFLPVVRALEEAFRCAFVRKEWHEVRGQGMVGRLCPARFP